MPDFMSNILGPPWRTLGASTTRGLALALVSVAATTVLVVFLLQFLEIGRVGGIYIIPVLFAAIRWGLWPGLVAAIASVGLISYVFTPPLFSFQSRDWEQVVRLAVFVLVAVVSSRLALTLKKHAEAAERATNEARMRAETEHMREALIGSVSHELRTPLSSILGATTVLASAPAVTADPKLAALACVVRSEAERLNDIIQNLLDATRISSEGLRPRFEWAEVADIVNAALERHGTRLEGHAVQIDLANELPLVYVDPNLIEQALSHVIANAIKYSPPASLIRVSGRVEDGALVVAVADCGAGLSPEELSQLGERFFRGGRTAAATTGSGLGIWIAKAFLHANGGSLEAISGGVDLGTTVILRLPIPAQMPVTEEAAQDDAR